jgi:phosphate transport system substrate-binding protein
VAPTFILLPTNPTDAARNAIVRRFFDWCFANGSQLAADLEYIPLPESVHSAVRASWRQSFGA